MKLLKGNGLIYEVRDQPLKGTPHTLWEVFVDNVKIGGLIQEPDDDACFWLHKRYLGDNNAATPRLRGRGYVKPRTPSRIGVA